MKIGDAVQYSMTETVWSQRPQQYGERTYPFWTGKVVICYPSLRGTIIDIREKQIRVSWDAFRTIFHLVKTGEGLYHEERIIEPYQLTYWHPKQFISLAN